MGKDVGAIVSFFSWSFLKSIPNTPVGIRNLETDEKFDT
jgi:hypothetical protein